MTANALETFSAGSRVSVLLPLSLGTTYDYRVPDGLSLNVGDVVRVPLGPRVISGVVWGEGEDAIEDKRLKDVVARHDCPPFPDVSRRFVTWVARYTMHMPGAVEEHLSLRRQGF